MISRFTGTPLREIRETRETMEMLKRACTPVKRRETIGLAGASKTRHRPPGQWFSTKASKILHSDVSG